MERTARTLLETFGYAEIKIPIFEFTELFARSIGTATDIVEKEMYTFQDRDGKSVTLRPEGTASVIRAYIEHHLWTERPLTKLYYVGPMFRHERPQAGRFRQFYQIGAEILGTANPLADAELLTLLDRFFHALGVTPTTLLLNSLGCSLCRPAYRDALQRFLRDHAADLCEACRRRIDTNPLRVLDCKREECRTITQHAPVITGFLGPECIEPFEEVTSSLDATGIRYRLEPRLVRGLDYYTKTAFEFTAEGLGAQNTIAAGGRYDGLVEALGGPPTPGVGFAMGIERVVALLKPGLTPPPAPDVFLAALGKVVRPHMVRILTDARDAGLRVETDYDQGGLKGQMRRADRVGARYVVILGEDELAKGAAVVRDMTTKSQTEVRLAELVSHLVTLIPPDSNRRSN